VAFIIDKVIVCRASKWLEIVARKKQRTYTILLCKTGRESYELRLSVSPPNRWILAAQDCPNMRVIRHHVEILKESFVTLQQICDNKAYQQQLFSLTGIYIYRGEDINTLQTWVARRG
jgi:hypothetical protein